MEIRFRGSKGDQGRKGAVLVRTRGKNEGEGDAVQLLVELLGHHRSKGEELGKDTPLMAFRSGDRWKVWTRG